MLLVLLLCWPISWLPCSLLGLTRLRLAEFSVRFRILVRVGVWFRVLDLRCFRVYVCHLG